MTNTKKILIGVSVFTVLSIAFAYWYFYRRGELDINLVLKKGVIGNEVVQLQKNLNKWSEAKLTTNGYFDGRTEAALYAYAKRKETTLRTLSIFRIQKTEHPVAPQAPQDRTPAGGSNGNGGSGTPMTPA